jgi:hypothetical protein
MHKPFLSHTKDELKELHRERSAGNVEVNCPWWNKDHWVQKDPRVPFFTSCFYRIKKH